MPDLLRCLRCPAAQPFHPQYLSQYVVFVKQRCWGPPGRVTFASRRRSTITQESAAQTQLAYGRQIGGLEGV